MKTIVANATPLINSAIHIIRLSGPDAFNILNKVLKKPIIEKGYTIQRNQIISSNEIIDDVLLSVFVSPNSFTGENVVEINNHGNAQLTKDIIDLLIENGACMAEPGEFSMQAMVNNKMTYSQIEAMNNLINSKNKVARKYSIKSLLGQQLKQIEEIRSKIFMIMGNVEVNIDYPEYDDVPELTHNDILEILIPLKKELNDIYETSSKILPIFDGYKIAIVGKPNVGKSSLLNLLSKEEKAIVSSVKGTTRDVIESNIVINNINVKLLDTAGVRNTKNKIEKIGVEKSLQVIEKADLVIWLVESNDDNDKQIYEAIKNRDYIKVYNKSDIGKKNNCINISVKNNDIKQLIKELDKRLIAFDAIAYNDLLILQSDRQIKLLSNIITDLDLVIDKLKNNELLDLLQSYFENIINNFNKILGINFEYDKLDELFKNFCLGK